MSYIRVGIKVVSGKDLFRDFKLGEAYKYHIIGYKKEQLDKGDPFANFWEKRPLTASITWDMYYEWKDKEWMKKRKKHNSLEAPWSVYEVHLASWQRPDKNDEESYNTYDQITERLSSLCKRNGIYPCGIYAGNGTSF